MPTGNSPDRVFTPNRNRGLTPLVSPDTRPVYCSPVMAGILRAHKSVQGLNVYPKCRNIWATKNIA